MPGSPAIPRNEAHKTELDNFILAVPLGRQQPQFIVASDKLIVNNWENFVALVRENPTLQEEPEVLKLVNLVNSIAGACGCVQGALRESAQGMYGQLLPVIHARNPKVFDAIKTNKRVGSIIFKEGPLVLLEV
jgi:hypothetical protein